MFQPSVHDLDLLRIRLILEEEGRREKKPLLQRIAGFFGVEPMNGSQAQVQAQTTNTSKYQPRPGLKNTARILHRRQVRYKRL